VQGRGGRHHRSRRTTLRDPRRRARPTGEDDTATTFELFFDLVYVFAMTEVTGYMVHAHDALGVLQGLLVLALLWWTWCAYAWLGNQARADTGVVRGAMAVAMAALFVVALTIPEAWDDAEGASTGRSYWSAPTCSCGACT
jgi:low temperature requirement protein LtrA